MGTKHLELDKDKFRNWKWVKERPRYKEPLRPHVDPCHNMKHYAITIEIHQFLLWGSPGEELCVLPPALFV